MRNLRAWECKLTKKSRYACRLVHALTRTVKNLRLALGGSLQWSSQCRYLGVYFVSGRAFRCSFDQYKCRYYMAFNTVFSKVGRFASEKVVLDLIRNKCLPVLLYGVEACPMLVRDKRSLTFTVTRSLITYEAISDWICDCCQWLHEFFSLLASESSNRYSYSQIFGKFHL